ncbi:MAG: metabolite traffic protein EboE [Planctomycetota bacterium]
MLLAHADHPGRIVRLGYGLNFGAAEDLDGILALLRATAPPLALRLGLPGAFGAGVWLPAPLALELGVPAGEAERERLLAHLLAPDLDPFTWNAFPWGGFHSPGLKARVFRPTWRAPERLAYTLAVADIAIRAHRRASAGGHVSISTHAGMHASEVRGPEDLDAAADNFVLAALHLARLEAERGVRVVLALEPEPRSAANDTGELAAFFERLLLRSRTVLAREMGRLRSAAEEIVVRHLGTCLDACHSAVEFEDPSRAVALATNAGTTLGKLQLTNALRLLWPGEHAAGRERLLAMDEPVFLHQLTARRGKSLDRAGDLPEVRAAGDRGDPRWRAAEEWRCHFHVPLDLESAGEPGDGLATTRAHAAAVLAAALAVPARWGSDELHLEIETYTWTVLPATARGTGSRLDGQERELRTALAWLAAAGWHPAPEGSLSPPPG